MTQARISKSERLLRVFDLLRLGPPCRSGLGAYRQISEALNVIEDEQLGPDSWRPPKSFLGQPSSERMYPTYPENMLAVPGYPGNTALWHVSEVVFVSRFGAIEVRQRDERAFEETARA
jgi:hypothetical protein